MGTVAYGGDSSDRHVAELSGQGRSVAMQCCGEVRQIEDGEDSSALKLKLTDIPQHVVLDGFRSFGTWSVLYACRRWAFVRGNQHR
jgi:hypothetical protein